LINTSAADLIDFDALLSALKFGNVKAAALDMLPTQQWESMTNNSLLQEQTNFYGLLARSCSEKLFPTDFQMRFPACRM
jgi:lactate dehydrogenase-like 2-hydroxyacid dehydrogenase